MRRLTIAGNLGAKPELRQTNNGTDVCTLRVATNERIRVQGEWKEEVLWVSVPLFDKRATALSSMLDKGSPVAASGMLEIRTYQNKQNETKVDVTLRNADVKLLGGKSSTASSSGSGGGAPESDGFPSDDFKEDLGDIPY